MEDQQYQIELANHANFYRAQKELAMRLEGAILGRYYNRNNDEHFHFIVSDEVRKELENLNMAESMSKPNAPGYYRANND